jgi:Fe-S-cluster containining protein
MNVEKIVNKARKSIGAFCNKECKAYCCRKGYLVLDKKETKLIMDTIVKKSKDMNCIKKINNEHYTLFLGDESKPCPGLLDFKCTIHKNKNRPLACQEYPIFIRDNKIDLSHRCLAVKQGLFYGLISQLKKLGYEVEETDSSFDSDFYNLKV